MQFNNEVEVSHVRNQIRLKQIELITLTITKKERTLRPDFLKRRNLASTRYCDARIYSVRFRHFGTQIASNGIYIKSMNPGFGKHTPKSDGIITFGTPNIDNISISSCRQRRYLGMQFGFVAAD